MNRLKTELHGGMPLHGDDLRFIDDANRTAMSDILKSSYENYLAVVLHGCKVTEANGGYNVTEGAIFYNNEVWHVNAHYFPAPIPLYAEPNWCFTVKPGPLGSKNFFNGETYNVHEIRQAVLSMNPVSDQIASIPASLVIHADTLNKKRALLPANQASGVYEADGQQKPSDVVQQNNVVFIDAIYICNNLLNSALHVATLPADFRPKNQIRKLIQGYTASKNIALSCYIETSGKIYVQRLESFTLGGVESAIYLNLSFYRNI